MPNLNLVLILSLKLHTLILSEPEVDPESELDSWLEGVDSGDPKDNDASDSDSESNPVKSAPRPRPVPRRRPVKGIETK